MNSEQAGKDLVRLLDAQLAVSVFARVVKPLNGVRYCFMEPEAFGLLCRSDPAASMRVYWYEILERSHFAASASLLRAHRWLSGMLASVKQPNALAFGACFRGFLESAADTHDTLTAVPDLLVASRQTINLALSGRLEVPQWGEELENKLIHFSHARGRMAAVPPPPGLQAKTTKNYLDSLSRSSIDGVESCYAELCELTHPAADSVLAFLGSQDPEHYHLDTMNDEAQIAELLFRHRGVIVPIVMVSLTTPVVILKLLTYFPEKALHTCVIDEAWLEARPLWRRIEEAMRKSQDS